jgi:hypothetical protein
MNNVDRALEKLDAIRVLDRERYELLCEQRKVLEGALSAPDITLRRLQRDAYARALREIEAVINKLKYDARGKPPEDVKEYLRLLRASIPTSLNSANGHGKPAPAVAKEQEPAKSPARRKKARRRKRSGKPTPSKSTEALHEKSTT